MLSKIKESKSQSIKSSTIVKKTQIIAEHWKKREAYPDDIYEAFAQVVDIVQAPLVDKGLFFRMLNTKEVPLHFFFQIFYGEKGFRESKKGWDSPKIGHGDNLGSGKWTITAGTQKAPLNSVDAGKGLDNRITYEYVDYKPRGSNLMVNGVLNTMYRSEGIDATGKTVGATGFTPGTKEQPNVEVLEISGLYKAKLKFTYKYGGVHSDVTVEGYNEKLFGNSSMFTGDNMSKIEFFYASEILVLEKELLKKFLYVPKEQ
ncbi:hypothetical protein KUCAC02_037954 [Chaenocephalus aceratus]|nr:hypothetical protein KUCAC02_037954 [Chaenocephalus aceratus]